MTGTEPGGSVAAGFEEVRAEFAGILGRQPTSGAAVAIRVGGDEVVDLWGGDADYERGRAWRRETPSLIFSCTKGLMSILAARLVQDGRLDYADPVVLHWPEYGAAGKDRTTVGDLLAHRAGLPALHRNLGVADIIDWDRMTALIAEEAPWWEPGTGHAYHPITHGWLVGEVLRRITGKLPGALLQELVTEPLSADAWIGLPPERSADVAQVEAEPVPAETELLLREAEVAAPWLRSASTLGHALPPQLVGPLSGFNDPMIQAAQVPGAGGIATARALATIWSSTVVDTDGVRLIESGVVERASIACSEGRGLDGFPGPWTRWGMGFQLDSPARRYLSDGSFGHDGAGGQVTFADPARGVGFAFVTNRMLASGDDRASRLIDALRRALTYHAAIPPSRESRRCLLTRP